MTLNALGGRRGAGGYLGRRGSRRRRGVGEVAPRARLDPRGRVRRNLAGGFDGSEGRGGSRGAPPALARGEGSLRPRAEAEGRGRDEPAGGDGSQGGDRGRRGPRGRADSRRPAREGRRGRRHDGDPHGGSAGRSTFPGLDRPALPDRSPGGLRRDRARLPASGACRSRSPPPSFSPWRSFSSRARRFGSSRETAGRRKRPSPNAPRRRRGSTRARSPGARPRSSRRSGTRTCFDGPARAPPGRLREERSGGAATCSSAWRSRPLRLLAFFGFGLAARLGATLSKHRVAYLYIVPAMLAMIVLVFFPFLYGIALSFTERPSTTPASRCRHLGSASRTTGTSWETSRSRNGRRTVLSSFNYLNFYWTLGFTIVWTISNVAIGVTLGLLLALILNTAGLEAAAGLPGPADPARGRCRTTSPRSSGRGCSTGSSAS